MGDKPRMIDYSAMLPEHIAIRSQSRLQELIAIHKTRGVTWWENYEWEYIVRMLERAKCNVT